MTIKYTNTSKDIILSAFYADQFPIPAFHCLPIFRLFNCLFNSSFVFDLRNAETKAGKVQISFYFYLIFPKFGSMIRLILFILKGAIRIMSDKLACSIAHWLQPTKITQLLLFLFKLIKSDFFSPWNQMQSPQKLDIISYVQNRHFTLSTHILHKYYIRPIYPSTFGLGFSFR